MKKIFILMAVAFALAAGSITLMTVHPQQAAGRKPTVLRGSTPILRSHPDPWHRTVPLIM